MSKMFPFITETWNPLGGECQHKCSYCWARGFADRYKMEKYNGNPTLNLKELNRIFKETDFVFTCDMCDLFGEWVPKWIINNILATIRDSPATFLLLTKNPARYKEFDLPKNAVAGATIECDMAFKVCGEAPAPYDRIMALRNLKVYRKMVSIEPVMKFTENFPYLIASLKPEFVAVGADNYANKLPEPSLSEIMNLISVLEDFGIKVYKKTLREAWNKNE